MGLAGGALFITILVLIWRTIYQAIPPHKELRLLLVGFCAGMIALLVNAILIDIFEASKVAYTFWIMGGVFVAIADRTVDSRQSTEEW
jgi:O-antigen ligase